MYPDPYSLVKALSAMKGLWRRFVHIAWTNTFTSIFQNRNILESWQGLLFEIDTNKCIRGMIQRDMRQDSSSEADGKVGVTSNDLYDSVKTFGS